MATTLTARFDHEARLIQQEIVFGISNLVVCIQAQRDMTESEALTQISEFMSDSILGPITAEILFEMLGKYAS